MLLSWAYELGGNNNFVSRAGGGRNGKDPKILLVGLLVLKELGSFPFLHPPPPPQRYWQNYYFPLADMLSWAVWFKFLLNKVIANTYLFILTSFSKQSASWKVLEIFELCALTTDSRKTYSLNKYMYTGSSRYSFDWGEIIRWGGGGERKRPKNCKIPVQKQFKSLDSCCIWNVVCRHGK